MMYGTNIFLLLFFPLGTPWHCNPTGSLRAIPTGFEPSASEIWTMMVVEVVHFTFTYYIACRKIKFFSAHSHYRLNWKRKEATVIEKAEKES